MSTLVELKYGYDRASNRTYRRDEVARSNSAKFDDLYGYDGLDRLTSMDRGELNGGNTALVGSPTLTQDWPSLHSTGNWNHFQQGVVGALDQTRTHNAANEITNIARTVGDLWPTPGYDDNGNTTSFPAPRDLESSLTGTYDAWNRLVKLENGGTVAEYQYDGLNRRTAKTIASETRHAYFSDRWQVLEERVDSSTDPERQFLWGERYVDDLVRRDRDTTGNGTLDERLYALQDALFNVVAVTDDTGDVKERFAYQPYGKSKPLNPDFTTYSGTNYEWEYRFTGRELDLESGLQINRNRYLHLEMGRWLARDPIGYEGSEWNLYEYVGGTPTGFADLYGLVWIQPGIDPGTGELTWGPYRPPLRPNPPEVGLSDIKGGCGSLAWSIDSKLIELNPGNWDWLKNAIQSSLKPTSGNEKAECAKGQQCCPLAKLKIVLDAVYRFRIIQQIGPGVFGQNVSATVKIRIKGKITSEVGICVPEECECPKPVVDQTIQHTGDIVFPLAIPYPVLQDLQQYFKAL